MSKKISIVLPVYNEEAILKKLYHEIIQVLNDRKETFEFIFINDGSTDRSLEQLLEIQKNDDRVCVLDLTRNFGHHNSLSAGLVESNGDAVILMDTDMEDEPIDILKLMGNNE